MRRGRGDFSRNKFGHSTLKFGKFTMFGTSNVSSPRCLRLKPSNHDCQAGRKCTRIHTRRSRESGPNNGGVKSRWENCDARQSVKDDRNATKHRIGPASEGREGRGVRLRSRHRHLRFESNFQISQVQQLPSHTRGDQGDARSLTLKLKWVQRRWK